MSTDDERFETRAAVFTKDPRGFLRKVFKEGIDHTIADARDDIQAMAKLTQGERMPILVDARTLRSADQDSRNFWSGKEVSEYVKGVAVITGNSPVVNMIGNIMMAVSKPIVPTKLFASEQAAMPYIDWFLDEEHDSPPPSIRIF